MDDHFIKIKKAAALYTKECKPDYLLNNKYDSSLERQIAYELDKINGEVVKLKEQVSQLTWYIEDRHYHEVKERKLRNQCSGLMEAWENYQAVLKLVSD